MTEPAEIVVIVASEAAIKLQVPSYQVIRWIQAGFLTGAKEGSRWYATLESVEKFAAEREAK
jgi:hypothetical protein